jgi:hypothetical protein
MPRYGLAFFTSSMPLGDVNEGCSRVERRARVVMHD